MRNIFNLGFAASIFEEILSLENLASTLATVEKVANKVANVVDHPDSTNQLQFCKLQKILDQTVLSDVQHIWPIFHALSLKRSTSIINLWVQQKQLLLANMLVWEWLAKRLENAYDLERDDPSSEMGRLIRRIETIIATQPPSAILDASDFLAQFNPGEAIFEMKRKNKQYTSATKEHTLTLTSIVLREWLGFPPSDKSQSQAWFIRELVDCVGEQLLLLEGVWKAAHDINTYVLGRGKNFRIQKTEIQMWAGRYLGKHILTDQTSKSYKVLCSIDAEVQAIMTANSQGPKHAINIHELVQGDHDMD